MIIVSENGKGVNFIGGNGVVLVHDRDDAGLEHLPEAIDRVVAVQGIEHGMLRHQNLSAHVIILGKNLLVDHHELGLSDSGAGLFLCDGLVFLADSKRPASNHDGS